jgi:outer membrane protein TolC
MRTLTIMLAFTGLMSTTTAHAQNSPEPDLLPTLAQAVLDSSVAIELANLPGIPLTLEETQAIALQRATRVRIARAGAAAARGALRSERGTYDPELYGEVERLSDDVPTASFFAGADVLQSDATVGGAGVRWMVPLGTEFSASLNARRFETNSEFALLSPEYTAFGELLVTQPLLDGFGVGERGELDAAERLLEAAEARLAEARLATRTEVETVYWDLYAAGRDFTVQRIITQRADALLDQAETRSRIGVSSPADVANARVFLAEQQQALLDARERLGDTSDVLASLIGARPPDGEELFRPVDEPPDDFPVVPVDDLITAAESQNYQLQALERDVAAIRARQDQARRNALPNLDLFGGIGGNGLSGTAQEIEFGGEIITTDVSGGLGEGVSQVFQRQYPNWRVGLSFSIPIGNRSDGGERDRIEAEVIRSEQRLEEVRRAIDASVRTAYRALANGRERLESARFGVDASGEQVRIGVLEFESGRTSAFELVRLGGDLAAAQQRYSRALVRTAKAAAVLRLLTGGAYPAEETQQ